MAPTALWLLKSNRFVASCPERPGRRRRGELGAGGDAAPRTAGGFRPGLSVQRAEAIVPMEKRVKMIDISSMHI